MDSHEIRKKFINFFQQKKHEFVPGTSTIPAQDPTILFTIAGMAQFKSCLTGEEKRPYHRATNSQKCIRASDLDDVGHDGRHLTMFEMLGSWSFGDYYKEEAIFWAYEFAIDVLKMDKERLWVTVHHTDKEAQKIWEKVGMPQERIVSLGDKDNFWAMGPTGPCGPCSELYYDQGPHVGKDYHNNSSCQQGPGCDCDRYLEFWNLVFMQYNRRANGTLDDLPMKSVDTGSGLERLTAILQGKTSCFEIDTFVAIRQCILQVAGIFTPLEQISQEQVQCTNVIADHLRMLIFTLADGARFSNEGRGYVLRRVLRRAVRYAYRLAPLWPKSESFLSKIVSIVVDQFSGFYPEIRENQYTIEEQIATEELRFSSTLEIGLLRFQHFAQEAKEKNSDSIPGNAVFILHDSFGFPADLTKLLCLEMGLKCDLNGFEKQMQEQKDRSRAESKFYASAHSGPPWSTFHEKDMQASVLAQDREKFFAGYNLSTDIIIEGQEYAQISLHPEMIKRARFIKPEDLKQKDQPSLPSSHRFIELVIEQTPFYPQGGGQVADSGFFLVHQEGKELRFEVYNVFKIPGAIVHVLQIPQNFMEDDADVSLKDVFLIKSKKVTAYVNLTKRAHIARHHTSTHLLHKALQIVLGNQVRQAGSLVHADGFRFDFSYHKPLLTSEITQIENLILEEILKNTEVFTHEDIPIDKAKSMGAMAMFDEKYDNTVRVLQIGNFSMELCGGTHVKNTGQIGLFKITSEGGVTSGVRRIEAVAGEKAFNYLRDQNDIVKKIEHNLKSNAGEALQKIENLKQQIKDQEKQIEQIQQKLIHSRLETYLQKAKALASGVDFLCLDLKKTTLKEMELVCDLLKSKKNLISLVGGLVDDKIALMSSIHPDTIKAHPKLNAGLLVRHLSAQLGGKGGGRADFARGGGAFYDQLSDALGAAHHLALDLFFDNASF